MPELHVIQDCRTLQLGRGVNTLIDESSFVRVGHLPWHAVRNGHTFYAWHTQNTGSRTTKNKSMTALILHRVLADAPNEILVDHKNGDGLDNRCENIRIATRSQNGANRRRVTGKSRFKGVNFHRKRRRWRAAIGVHGKQIWLGEYHSEEDAARAYDRAAREHFGEFACTNVDIHGPY